MKKTLFYLICGIVLFIALVSAGCVNVENPDDKSSSAPMTPVPTLHDPTKTATQTMTATPEPTTKNPTKTATPTPTATPEPTKYPIGNMYYGMIDEDHTVTVQKTGLGEFLITYTYPNNEIHAHDDLNFSGVRDYLKSQTMEYEITTKKPQKQTYYGKSNAVESENTYYLTLVSVKSTDYSNKYAIDNKGTIINKDDLEVTLEALSADVLRFTLSGYDDDVWIYVYSDKAATETGKHFDGKIKRLYATEIDSTYVIDGGGKGNAQPTRDLTIKSKNQPKGQQLS